jgi:hypothetical protein
MPDINSLTNDNAPDGAPDPERREEQRGEQEEQPRRGPTLLERRFTQQIPGGRLEYTFSAGPMLNLRMPPPLINPVLSPIQETLQPPLQEQNSEQGNIVNPQSPIARPEGLATPLASPGFNSMLQYLLGISAAPMVPMPWQSAEWERLVAESMQDTGGVKRVASAEGLKEVKVFEYSKEGAGTVAAPTSPKEEMCAITQMAFEEGDLVAEMPCGHRFDKECLFRWLETESAACPVCRKEVDSREVSENEAIAAAGTGDAESDEAAVDPPVGDGTGGQLTGENEPQVFPRIIMRRNGITDARAAERVALERLYEFERQREDDILEAAMVAAVMQMSLDEV